MSETKVYTVGWVCAITTEYVAARAFLDEIYEGPDTVAPHDNNEYTLGRIGKHNVVIAVLPQGEYGTNSAASVAKDLLRSFPEVRIGLMVGIGGGAPTTKHDIRLGDVVVSVPGNGTGGVFHYDYGKLIQGQNFLHTGFLNQPPVVLRTAVTGLQARYEEADPCIDEKIRKILDNKRRLRKKYGRSDQDSDRLYNPNIVHPAGFEENCTAVCSQDPLDFIVRQPRSEDDDDPAIHYGLIASANTLMKDASVRDSLAQDSGVLCFEMEAAGLMNNFPCLIIRGICDYSDTHKNKVWQGYAAMSAAAYAKDLLNLIKPNKVEAEQRLGELVTAAFETLNENAQSQKDIAQKHYNLAQSQARQQLTDRESKVLQMFRLTRSDEDATYESYKNRVEDRVEGTCTWVLEHENFSAWLQKDTGPLLVSADPGCGKSVLAKFLIDDILPRTSTTSTICYFFFKELDQNTVRQALCALLHQLFISKPALLRHAMNRFEKEGNGLINSVATLWSIFNDAVHDSEAGSIIVVMDALDECFSSELKDMLRNVARQSGGSQETTCKLKLLLTSRPYKQILSTFRSYFDDASNVRIPGEDESKTISEEVNLVIRYRVEMLAKEKELTADLAKELADRLLEIPHRTYLWVYLIFDFLENGHIKKTKLGITMAMKTLPKSVNAAYDQLLSKSNDEKIVRRALAIILAAKRPLSLAEMNVAMSIEPAVKQFSDLDLESERDFLRTLRTWCGLFVSVYEGKVHFLHQTAREFLLADLTTSAKMETALRWQHSISPRDAEAELAEICMHFLNLDTDENIPPSSSSDLFIASMSFTPGISGPAGQHWSLLPTTIISNELRSFLVYAVNHWDDHFNDANLCEADVDLINLALKISAPTSSIYKSRSRAFRAATSGAMRKGSERLVELLLETGADAPGVTLYSCINNSNIMEIMLDHADASDPRCGTVLGAAASNGNESTVQLLSDRGADAKNSAVDLWKKPALLTRIPGHHS